MGAIQQSPWKLSQEDLDRALLDASPLDDLRQQQMKQIGDILATGRPVRLTMAGKTIGTYFPDGSYEDGDGFRYQTRR